MGDKELTANIGKILFIDNEYEDAVQKAVTNLVEKGITVQFWNGQGEMPSYISNVRVVVIDLDLANIQMKTDSLAYYSPILEILHKIPGPLVVLIMAREYEDTDPINLNTYYEEAYGTFHGAILTKGLTKDEEIADPPKLLKLISSSIEDDKNLQLLLAWEMVVDKAQDKAFNQLITSDVKTTIPNLVRSICRDFTQDSAARELVNAVMQLVSRQTKETQELILLDKLVKQINDEKIVVNPKYPCENDLSLYNKLMFYEPNSEEPVWTGDIYKTKGMSKYDDYAIVLTPVCDFANSKTSRVLLCFGFPILEEAFVDIDYPPYKIDFDIKKKAAIPLESKEIVESIKNRYLLGKSKTTENLYTLWNFMEKGKTFGLCFDFNNIQTLEIEELKKWERIQRLDFPFKQHILETYGRFMSRVGTAEINKSPQQLKEKLDKEKKVEEQKTISLVKKISKVFK